MTVTVLFKCDSDTVLPTYDPQCVGQGEGFLEAPTVNWVDLGQSKAERDEQEQGLAEGGGREGWRMRRMESEKEGSRAKWKEGEKYGEREKI